MLRKYPLATAVAVSLSLPGAAFAASVHGRRHVVHHWHGYGFLPGYHQPPNNSVPMYRSKESNRGTPDFFHLIFTAPRHSTIHVCGFGNENR